MLHQELLGQGLGDVPLVAKQFAEKPTNQWGNGPAVVDFTWCEAEREQLAAVIDHQVELEPIEPADRGFASTRIDAKDPVLSNPGCATDRQGGGVDEADPGARAQLGMQVDREWGHDSGQQLNEAIVADEPGELGAQLDLDLLDVKRFEGPVVGLLKEDGNGHDLAGMQLGGSSALPHPCRQLFALPGRGKALPKCVHRTVDFEYTHGDTSRLGLMGIWYVAS